MSAKREQRLLEEIARLRRQVMDLTTTQAALEAQHRLLEGFVAMARSRHITEAEIIKNFLHETLTLSTRMTGAERGSLLLVNSSGRIEDAIFTEPTLPQQSSTKLFNQYLDRGVAGWIRDNNAAVLIDDTRLDERWLSWPDDRNEIRSVLGVPLFKQKVICGVLTLLHTQVRHFSSESWQLMQATASQISIVLENAQLYGQLHHYSQTLDAELDKGRQIQINFLPATLPDCPGWELATHFQPAYQVAGDFYDVFELPDQQLGLVIADVCDKGVGAALFMGLFRSLMRIFSGQTTLSGLTVQAAEQDALDGSEIPISRDSDPLKPLRAICLTNDYVALNHGDLGMFATLFFGVLNLRTGCLTYASGGHEPLLVVSGEGHLKAELKATGPALGIVPQMRFKAYQTHLQPGDVLVGYTDGVVEARAVDTSFFTKARLLETLLAPISSAQELLQRIMQQVLNHTESAQRFDDITLLAVRRQEREEIE